jgi:hypothetical protein
MKKEEKLMMSAQNKIELKDHIDRVVTNLTPTQRSKINKFVKDNLIISCTAFCEAKLTPKNEFLFPWNTTKKIELVDIMCNACFEKTLEHNCDLDKILSIDGKYELGIWAHLLAQHPDLFL